MPLSNLLHYEEGDKVPGSHILPLHVIYYNLVKNLDETVLARVIGRRPGLFYTF